jgi:hypothetical protein
MFTAQSESKRKPVQASEHVLALGILNSLAYRESASRRFLATPCNLNSHNHNQHAGRPCFSLAFLIGRTKSALNYAISRFFAHEQIPFSLH